ncbi:aspartyl-tRNA(Asn)/glutamyl-tRNA(Gln) amidotransferase subunit A [Angulomicrobium tetraedrale]|uniref:Aspartyl-tRNA(Asn)/glutamyl-tRNA(Gln) amidotransferase subunit A n=1 Tax=Ancylobacter tetraedralis TaxID=217068 RepID=A0A839Z2A7_9HYPH|nr:AtzE family amidohydrolase [Ancylobacter tetraedralis]MBB3769749.1 aspartyl-tRNA(Asn)/glutamyl-tRNA(Gln) amidotransferase subunit A [Ancylobacter tetraedralis]
MNETTEAARLLAGPALALANAVSAGKVSARSVTEAALARIAQVDPVLNAFTDVTSARARAEAAAIDARRAAGAVLGPLAGVPFAVKNLFDLEGLSTRAGSRINRDRPPAPRDATLVERLTAAGAVCLGGLNMGEYAYDFTGENLHDGNSRNPHDTGHMSGGSSGGSGSAVGGKLVPLSLGSDTNGSIRVPSSFCGIFGLKPTYGRLSRARSFPFVASLDHLGPFARHVADLAATYDALLGPDPDDAALADKPAAPTLPGLEEPGHLRVAVLGGWFARSGTPQAYEAVARAARALDATTVVELPEVERARASAYLITMAEGAALHRDRLRERPGEFDPAVRERLLAGAVLPAAWIARAQNFRRWFRDRAVELFAEWDVLIAPATPVPAPRSGQATFVLDGREMLVRPNIGIYTQPISFIGLPVVAAPIATDNPLPIAVQLIAAPWQEAAALRAARVLERAGIAVAPEPVV